MAVDTLSALDECFLRLETDAAHMHVGWTMFVEGEPPSVTDLRTHVSQRLEHLPRFRRRVVCSPLRLHDPVWVDDDRLDLAHHIPTARVPEGSGPAATRELAGDLLSTSLDRSRPLWRLHLIDGLDGGRFALVGQVHHALVDGISAVEMAQLLLDPVPLGPPSAPRQFRPEPSPGILDRARASAGERLALTRSVGSLALRSLGGPRVVSEAAGELRRLGSVLATVGAPAPATLLNRPIGARRSVAFTRLPLHVAKELGRRHGATVNDIVLATASVAVGRYLRRYGEAHPWLRVLVPVSTRRADCAPLGNRVSAVFVELPVGERDPRAVLQEVSRQTRARRQAAHASSVDSLLRFSRLVPAPLRDAAAWLATRPQTFNAVLSNIPGPASPLYLLGRRVQSAYPAVPLVQGHGVSIGALSYCGSLHVGLYADPDVVPDVLDFAHDVSRSFDALRLALEPRAPRPRPRSRTRRASTPRVATLA